jgi:hypothetical protein
MSERTIPKITVLELAFPRNRHKNVARGTSAPLTAEEASRIRGRRPLFRPSRRLPNLAAGDQTSGPE